jgi:hypothetical protein
MLPITPKASNMQNTIIPKIERITLIIPSHMPIFAIVIPASEDLPALISFISFLPIIHAGIAAKIPHAMYDNIPRTKATIEFELAPPPEFPVFCDGGGGGLKLGGGGGGKLPLPESDRKNE